MAPGRRTIHPSEQGGTQTLRRERHAHKRPSMVRGEMLALPTASSGERRKTPLEMRGNSDAQTGAARS